ncbi:MAG TPA: hypothetical protein VMT69_17240 [Kineosporiaceae bacterium]|nr:hypothetical protein [Kineosporiaceae bacterium]
MTPSRTLLVSLAAGGLLVGGAITAGAISAGNASAAGAQVAAGTPTPSPSAPGGANGQAPRGGAPQGQGRPWLPGRGHGGPGGLVGGLRGLVGQGPVLHGEFVTGGGNGTTTTVVVQTGTVTAKSDSTITVKSTDGYPVTWTLTSDTTVRTGWSQGSVKDIATGDTVMVEGTRSGTTTTARFVAERPKNAAQGGSSTSPPSATPPTTS